jgi:dihydrofolate reductase
MGKLVVTEFITLDGVIQDPGGAEKDDFPLGGWAFEFDRGPEGDKFKLDELMAADAQLLGRKTYEGFAKAWPTMQGTGEFGEKMNGMPKYVVSSTLTDPTWTNTSVIGLDDVPGIKEQYDGDILVAGSAQLAQGLLERGLIDELHLMVFPVALGTGKRLFADGADRNAFELTDAKQQGETVTLILRRKSSL